MSQGRNRNRRRTAANRRRQSATGAPYASTANGTTHDHGGPELEALDGRPFGVERTVDMSAARSLIGAAGAGCQPCQRTLTEVVMAGDRLVIASLAGTLYSFLPAGPIAAAATKAFAEVAAQPDADGDYGRRVLAHVEGLNERELADLLQDTLDLWAGAAAIGATGSPARQGRDSGAPQDDAGPARAWPGTGRSVSCAYLVSAGVGEFLNQDDVRDVLRGAEAAVTDPEVPPIWCGLCDADIDVTAATEVGMGLVLQTVGGIPLAVPVWNHPRCGQARIWVAAAFDAERARRGLPPEYGTGEPAPRASEPASAEADYAFFSVAQLADGVYPLVVMQPGAPHPFGLLGQRTDLLSMGFAPVDLSGRTPPSRLEWTIRTEQGRLIEVSRRGAGPWYRHEAAGTTPGPWRQAARRHRMALVVVVPAGTLTNDGSDQNAALAAAGTADRTLGGLMPINGTL